MAKVKVSRRVVVISLLAIAIILIAVVPATRPVLPIEEDFSVPPIDLSVLEANF